MSDQTIMTITWTKCSERMPPKIPMLIICTWPESMGYKSVQTTEFLWKCINPHAMWAPYTPEAWAELNALDRKWLDDLPEFLKRQAD